MKVVIVGDREPERIARLPRGAITSTEAPR